jgi:hypothetical protein
LPEPHPCTTLAGASNPNEQFLAEPGRTLLSKLTDKQIRRGVHRSVEELKTAITTFLDHHNAAPKPFRWVKPANDILAAIERFCVYNTPST